MRLLKSLPKIPGRQSALYAAGVILVASGLQTNGFMDLSRTKILWEDSTYSMKATKVTLPPLEEYLYCDQNSRSPLCCSAEQCASVTKSTMFSECCNNTVTNSTMDIKQVRVQNATTPPRKPPPNTLFPILITATPRSGTKFMEVFLQELGVNITHDWKTPNMEGKGMISWMHIFQDVDYFGPALVGGSKFLSVWHQVRDPLKSLTSLSFTEPLIDEFNPNQQFNAPWNSTRYIFFLKKHIHVTSKEDVEKIMTLQDSSLDKQENATLRASQLQEDILIWRGLEFYLQWHQFILSLKVRRFQLEGLVVQKNMTLLDNIFKSMGQPPPNHTQALHFIDKDRRRQRRRLLQRRLHTNSRKHRPTLEWHDLCRVDPDKTQQFFELSHEFGYYLDREKAC